MTYGVWNGVLMSVLFLVSAVHLGFNISRKRHLTPKPMSMNSKHYFIYMCKKMFMREINVTKIRKNIIHRNIFVMKTFCMAYVGRYDKPGNKSSS